MWNILIKPMAAIAEAKKEKNLGKTLLVLLLSVIFAGASLFFFARSVSGSVFLVAVIGVIALFILSLIAGAMWNVVLKIFTGKSSYVNALTTMAYSDLIIFAGLLVGSILALIPTWVGPLLSYLAMAYAFIVGLCVWFKGTMELFGTEAIIVMVAYTMLLMGLVLAMYPTMISTMINMMGSFGAFTSSGLGGMGGFPL